MMYSCGVTLPVHVKESVLGDVSEGVLLCVVRKAFLTMVQLLRQRMFSSNGVPFCLTGLFRGGFTVCMCGGTSVCVRACLFHDLLPGCVCT